HLLRRIDGRDGGGGTSLGGVETMKTCRPERREGPHACSAHTPLAIAMRCFAALSMTGVFCLLALAKPAVAQQAKPSFDCAKASTDVEKLVCGSPELAKADSDLAAAYTALAAKLDAKAKEHLARDETGWIVRRSHECVGTASLMYDCVKYG